MYTVHVVFEITNFYHCITVSLYLPTIFVRTDVSPGTVTVRKIIKELSKLHVQLRRYRGTRPKTDLREPETCDRIPGLLLDFKWVGHSRTGVTKLLHKNTLNAYIHATL